MTDTGMEAELAKGAEAARQAALEGADPPDGGRDRSGEISKDAIDKLAKLMEDDQPPDLPPVEEFTEEEREAAPEPEKAEEPEKPAEKSKARAQAEAAIKRVGLTIPEGALAKMDEDEILEMGRSASDVHAERQREWLKRQSGKATDDTGEAPGDETEGSAPAPSDPGQPSWKVDELLQPLDEELDEKAAASVRFLAERLQALEGRVPAIQAAVDSYGQREVVTAVETARQQLGERFPGLADDEVFSTAVQPKLREILDMPSWQERLRTEGAGALPEVMEMAAVLGGLEAKAPEPEKAEPSAAALEESRQRRNGAPSSPGSPSGPYRSWSSKRLSDTMFEVAMDGEGRESDRYRAMRAEVARRRKAER